MIQSIMALFIAISTLLVQIQTTPNLSIEAKNEMIGQVGVILVQAQELVDAMPADSAGIIATTTPIQTGVAPYTQPVQSTTYNAPVYTAPVTQIAQTPNPPTCSLAESEVEKAYQGGSFQGYKTVLQPSWNTNFPATIDGKDARLPSTLSQFITATTTYTMTVTDNYNQTGTCSVTLVPPQPVCTQSPTVIIGSTGLICTY